MYVCFYRVSDKHQIEFEQLPKLFLHQGFNLENPDTFNAVFPWTQVESSNQGGKAVSSGKKPQSSKLLQEKVFIWTFYMVSIDSGKDDHLDNSFSFSSFEIYKLFM